MSRNKSRARHIQIITPEEEMENLRNEVAALKRTVESKSAAVNILRAELQECQKERDKFRTLVEDETLHRSCVSSASKRAAYSDPCRSAMLSGSEGTLAQLLSLSKEENKTLRLESTELRCKLHDAQADIKVLREETQRLKGGEARRRSLAHTATSQLAHQEREQFISQMEELSSKCQALEGDVRGLVEEREELVRELDSSSHKLHRLNHILNTILSCASPTSPHHPRRLIDLDAIITENRYLQERVKQTEEEKNLARSNASKYKAALDKSRTQGSIKLGTPENLIVTPKQVGELLRDYRGEVDGAAETDLRSLCVALVDALNQRSRALRTQRSANKVLVSRMTELERRLSNSGNPEDLNNGSFGTTDGESTLPQMTSLGLMEGYIPPSGPIPKYSEEDTLKDPRLIILLNSAVRTDQTAVEIGVCGDSQSNSQDKIADCPSRNDSEECSDSLIYTTATEVNKENHDIMKDESASIRTISDHKIYTTREMEENVQLSTNHSSNQVTLTKTDPKVQNEAEISVTTESVSNGKGNDMSDKSSRNKLQDTESASLSPTDYVSKQNTKQGKVSTYINPEDELEEIVPIDQLDLYIKEIQERRKSSKSTTSSNSELQTAKQDVNKMPDLSTELDDIESQLEKETNAMLSDSEAHTNTPLLITEDNNSSFDLDISDYDSDNDNLDLALQDWQNDFGKKEKKRSGQGPLDKKKKDMSKKERFGFWQKDSTPKATINPALQEFLDKATADAVDNGMDIP